MKKKIIAGLVILAVLTTAIIFSRNLIVKNASVFFLSKQFGSRVTINSAVWNLKDKIIYNDILITNDRRMECHIEKATLDYDIRSLLKDGINFKFYLAGVKLSYPDSTLISDIAKSLSMEPVKLLNFDYVKGRFWRKGNETIIQSLEAWGKLIKLNADGTISNNREINCSLKIFLSSEVISNIPESVRNIFFKEEGAWSEVSVYLTGNIKKPSVNFSTSLFKLSVR